MKKYEKHKVHLKRRRVMTDMLTAVLKETKDADLSVPMFSLTDFLQEKAMSTTH